MADITHLPRITRLPLDPFTIPAFGEIRPRPWLFGHWLMRGAVTLVAAPGGTGKTSLVTGMILSCATNRELIGLRPLKPLRVAFLGLEETKVEMQRRFAAAMIHHTIDPQDFADRVFYLDGKACGFSAAGLDQTGQVALGGDMERLVYSLTESRCDVLAADPLALAHSAPENDNVAMAAVIGYFTTLAQVCDCAVMLIHHTKKGAQAGDPDSIRGAGALINHARIAIGLSPMGDDDAKIFNVPRDEQRRLVRVDDLKLNYSLRAADATWLRLESINLPNKTEEYPYGDSVQVSTAWTPPQAEDAFTPAIANECLDAIDRGISGPKGIDRYSAGPNAGGKAAHKVLVFVMREHGHEISDNAARQIIKNWLTVQPAVLREETYHSPNDRKARIGLFVNQGNRP